jgi:N-acetylneuraminic acid mutarotase
VWTGSKMIVWGGFDGGNYLNTGGRYTPSTDSWTPTSTTNAAPGRELHTAVWTGGEMIVWGGRGGNFFDLNTGGRYNPGTDSWATTSTNNAPTTRKSHTAVWTGSEMIVWGGLNVSTVLNTGGRYNPGTDSWTATSTTNAPSARSYHTAVWTGDEMIAWGGSGSPGNVLFNTGGRYNPGTDNWVTTSTVNAPSARRFHTAVWTGGEMIVWGGYDGSVDVSSGGRYCAQTAPMAQSAFSRKIHGSAGTFDIPLPLVGNVGVECRSGGATNDYQMIINFANPVTVGSASVTSGTGSVSSFSVSGPQVTVNLTGVTNVQRITVTLFNVNDGTHMGNVSVSMGVLVGDVNGNAVVNASDVSLTKSQVGQPVTGSDFREDVNANGTISSTDVTQVKANVGTALP